MLLTVVYNESQYVAEYQDDYEKIKRPFELCDEGSKNKICKTTNIWRELLKNTDELFDDVHDFSREYAHDYIEEEETQQIGQKRNSQFKLTNLEQYDCRTTKNHGEQRTDSHPSYMGNVTCNYTANEAIKTWPQGWSCQPVEYRVKVLSRKVRDNDEDMSDNLKGCWLFRRIPMHKARALSKHTLDEDINGIPAHLKGCWKFEEKYIHVGCRLKYVG
ncbi:uncharacterized protein LOC119071309 [Bradysia coprophila]|uniref:uncharacterized protein LOC119071309 n=1 Tax=Bradysia coprophila TaxID=38358 RepID=UPI00187DC531|nr:uncharacterized protein LOC119071309 [Bradysia coprophila]